MTIKRILCRILLRVAMLAGFSLCGALNASADTYVYKDVRKPNGYPRDMAAKQADFAACGISTGSVTDRELPKFNRCMRAHGWALDHIEPDPSQAAARDDLGPGTYTYDDVSSPRGRARGYDEEQAATAARDGGDAGRIGTPGFNACMRRQGWRLAGFAPQVHDDGDAQREENAADAERFRDEQQRNDDFTRNLYSQP
jgi:hypothetical protein